MKKTVIFDNCYDTSLELEEDISKWIETENIEVIDIQVNTVNVGYIEYDYYNCPKDRDEKHVKNTIYWYATVIYEEE